MALRLKSFLWTWLPVALWLALIAIESTSFMSSTNTGDIIYRIVKALFGSVGHQNIELLNHVLRKLGHFTGYGILGLLFFRALRRTYIERLQSPTIEHTHVAVVGGNTQSSESTSDTSQTSEPPAQKSLRELVRRAANIAVLCTAAVASLDEWHQTFLPSRTGALHDVVLDTMGAVVLLIFVLAHYSRALRATEAE